MKRLIILAALAPLACSSAPERAPLTPLPDKVTPLPYAELLTRARSLAARGTEVTFVENWEGLQEVARNLEQTAEYLAKAADVPAKHADTIKTKSADLKKSSRELMAAASAKSEKSTDEALQRINRLVREMRVGE